MDETQVIAKIHADFEVNIMELVRQANETEFLESIRPKEMPVNKFLEKVERFSTFYPGNNFVTEKQVETICKKYGLVLGSMSLFSGTIPVKNRMEMRKFRLYPIDSYIGMSSLPGDVYRSFMDGTIMAEASFGYSGPSGSISVMVVFSTEKEVLPTIVPIGDRFTLIKCEGIGHRPKYNLWYRHSFYGSDWNILIGANIQPELSINGSTWWHTRMMLDISMEHIRYLDRLSIDSNVMYSVVAPGTMFEKYKEHIEVEDYKLRFKSADKYPEQYVFKWLNDPIVLQPVPGGYLVVTKWGAEANIPEIQNPGSN